MLDQWLKDYSWMVLQQNSEKQRRTGQRSRIQVLKSLFGVSKLSCRELEGATVSYEATRRAQSYPHGVLRYE